MSMVKFATQVEESVLAELRELSAESGTSISKLVTAALTEHLRRARVRPAFRSAMDDVLRDNKELLERLAK